jgi:hypothetical protein
MSVFIRNPEVERAARELARLKGQSLTEAIGGAIESALQIERAKPRPRPTVAEMKAATELFRRKVGLDQTQPQITRADFDALWDFIPDLPALDEIGESVQGST